MATPAETLEIGEPLPLFLESHDGKHFFPSPTIRSSHAPVFPPSLEFFNLALAESARRLPARQLNRFEHF